MPLPTPELGLIVHYAYVFHPQSKPNFPAGKHRPCLIAALFPDPIDPLKTGILYLPITHSPPGLQDAAIELTPHAKSAAGLDPMPQWLLISQGNQDTWPEDLFPLPHRPTTFAYGFLPPTTFKQSQSAFARLYAQRKFNIIPRNPAKL